MDEMNEIDIEQESETAQLSVLGKPLQSCSQNPLTGFYRTGCCETGPDDPGVHVVCVEVNEEFLEFSRSRGNDLTTPRGGFPGLKPGDRWCLCAARWAEALQADMAPPVFLAATHQAVLRFVPLEILQYHSIDGLQVM